MNVRERLNIPDELWETFKAWKPTVGADRQTDDWVELRMEIHRFIRQCYEDYEFPDPVVELGSWSLVPGGDFSYFSEKYRFYRTNVSRGNGKAPIDFLLDAMDMYPLANESVGCLIATDVLEHLRDPLAALKEFYRVLKNGAYALITVPFYFEIHDQDYYRFTDAGLRTALERAGFDDIAISCKGNRPLNIQAIARKAKRFSLLFLGGGTRCSHVEAFRKRFRVVTTDTRRDAPSIRVADKTCFTEPFASSGFQKQLMDIIVREDISAVLPASHHSIRALMNVRGELERLDVKVLIPDNDITESCLDKQKTAALFQAAGLLTVPVQTRESTSFPLYFKSSMGSGERDAFLVQNAHQLEDLIRRYDNYILQDHMDGDEYTIDVLCAFDGRLLLAVPRLRIEKRAGEILKGRVVHDKPMIACIRKLTEAVRFIGLFTVQCFERGGHFYFNEINPRFGGGLTFSIASGAPFVSYLERMIAGEDPEYNEQWTGHLTYSRASRDFPIRKAEENPSPL